MNFPFELFEYSVAFMFGAIIGSFLNVIIYRVPAGISIVKPASHCPNCDRLIKPYENIPILSYILLRAKCAGCKTSISLKYPFIEALTGLSAVGLVLNFGWNWDALIFFTMTAILIALSAIDFATYRLPNAITLTGAIAAVILTVIFKRDYLVLMLLGGLTGLSLLMLMGLIGSLLFRKPSLGMGDIKLAGMIGLFLGPARTVGMFFLGVFLGAIVGGLVLIMGTKKMGQKIPFGPYLAAGAVLALIYGKELWECYMGIVIR
jgi:leader peptidase (prepilin peptidase)/N-methyltransferase